MLSLRHIRKTYNPGGAEETRLFDDFSMEAAEGDFISIVGSNGSGKTSMLNIICGTTPLDGGSVTLNGRDFNPLKEYQRARYIGRVFQNPSAGTCARMTVAENMSLADNKGKPYNLSAGVGKKRLAFYREQLSTLNLGMEDKLNMKVGLLSGGQRQAIALLMSVIGSVELLILDEHTAALDPKTSENVMRLTDSVVRGKKITTIMVTHNLRHAIAYGNRIIMMHEGRIVLDLADGEKQKASVDDLLMLFAQISVELGN